ncbi:MAG: hypothetical protein LUE92_13100 [Clostridiales bacterium]|nr:hypothetical protein [Clostridiales bacterium]
MGGNREYKSDVFSMLMEYPEKALSVYNALNGSDYRDPSKVRMFKLEHSIQLSIRNDASFIVDSYLSLYEHQSSSNPNMPLRFLFYVTDLFKDIVKNRDLFSSNLVKIPTPSFVVFYNGIDERPALEHLKLSNAFEHPVDFPDLELKCKVYNINPGNNKELMDKCSVLEEYTIFVERVRAYKTQYPLEEALDCAIDSCVADHILEDFLRERRGEVKRAMTLDYTIERRLQLAREENREIIEKLTEKNEDLAEKNEALSERNNQLIKEKNQISEEKQQLAEENERLAAELARLKK